MAQEAEGTNQRLPLLDPASLNREQRNLYEQLQDNMIPWAERSGFQAETPQGQLLGPFNAYLYSPELGQAQMKYLLAERDATCLEARVREVVILTVGAVFGSAYEVYAHRAVAASAGLPAESIEALATGGAPVALSADEMIAHRFVKAITADRRVEQPLYTKALNAFGHKGLVDMLHLAGIYLSVSAMLNAFSVPVP